MMRGETPIGNPPFSVAEQKADFSRRGYPPPYSVDDGDGVGGEGGTLLAWTGYFREKRSIFVKKRGIFVKNCVFS